MKNTLFLLLISFLLFSCSKDNANANCDFIGKWCSVILNGDCVIGIELEFRSDGEFIQLGAAANSWESDNCETIDIISNTLNEKIQEFRVISISSDKMTLDAGAGPTEYTRIP